MRRCVLLIFVLALGCRAAPASHVDPRACAACHAEEAVQWRGSHPDRATDAHVEVTCQTCHGPGSRHAASPWEPLPANPDTCVPCHMQRTVIAADGPSLFDRFRPATLQDGLYFADGQILDEVLEYGSFAQSVMHERGVRCVDCHDPHSGRTPPGNAVCTQCHRPSPPARFPGLARRASNVDSPAHHHHAVTPGALCVSCHMPLRTYTTGARHDHSFRIPRPDLSVALRTPDACTAACHAGRDARWAAAKVAAWFPGPRPTHYGEVLDRARRDRASPDELRRLASDRGTPAIVRATAFELLRANTPGCLGAAASGLHDPSPLVRSAAVACGEHLAPATRVMFASDALRDPVRLVRIEAARILAGVPLPSSQRAAFAAARRELEESLALDPPHEPAKINLEQLAR